MRSGIIAKKIGMTRIFREDGRQVPVTVLKLEKLQVVAQRTFEKDGYFAVKKNICFLLNRNPFIYKKSAFC